MSNKVYEIITEKIIAMLESGTIPWEKPWKISNHKSLTTKKAYRGLNVFILGATAETEGYTSNYWGTWKQIAKLGGAIREGESKKYTIITFWNWIKKESDDGKESSFPILKYFRVYNACQADWGENEMPNDGAPLDFDPIEECESVIKNAKIPSIRFGGDKAYYTPDRIQMPIKESFKNPQSYYATLYHEAAHSTGHPSRLGRFELDNYKSTFGSVDYSFEELVAEMTAAMLCTITGIENRTIENSAAYIASWLQKFKDDTKMVVQAASKAQKAVDYILNVTW